MRPARPARCSADARLARTVSSRPMPVLGSKRGTRDSPASTTIRIPSMVRLLSAIEVASTTLRRPAGAGRSAASCCSSGRSPWSAATSTCAERPAAASSSAVRRISPSPGRKASTLPGSSASARLMAAAIARSMRSPGAGRSRCLTATGWTRPWLRTTGAPSSRVATAAASSVADITSTWRSGQSAARASRARASDRSVSSPRSWNSSKTTSPVPGRSGSRCSRRRNSPSVTTSMRVSRETRDSPRTL